MDDTTEQYGHMKCFSSLDPFTLEPLATEGVHWVEFFASVELRKHSRGVENVTRASIHKSGEK